MVRGLDGFLILVIPAVALCSFEGPGRLVSRFFPVALARGKHLFPFRTEQLSLSAPMVLGSQGPGRVGRRRFFYQRAALRGGSSRWRSGRLEASPAQPISMPASARTSRTGLAAPGLLRLTPGLCGAPEDGSPAACWARTSSCYAPSGGAAASRAMLPCFSCRTAAGLRSLPPTPRRPAHPRGGSTCRTTLTSTRSCADAPTQFARAPLLSRRWPSCGRSSSSSTAAMNTTSR
jgi:hypothetical protein